MRRIISCGESVRWGTAAFCYNFFKDGVRGMNIEVVVNPEMNENCYIVYDDNKIGMIIDPGSPVEIIKKRVADLGVKITHIFLTHCHYDHIEGLGELRNAYKSAKTVSSFECNVNIQNEKTNLSRLFSNEMREEPADIIVNDGDTVTVGNMTVKAIKTPGHTNGGMCYLTENELFSGDTLFLMSVGRWDFPTGDRAVLEKSVREKLYTLDGETIVHPGHGNITKIYYEKRYNGVVRE